MLWIFFARGVGQGGGGGAVGFVGRGAGMFSN